MRNDTRQSDTTDLSPLLHTFSHDIIEHAGLLLLSTKQVRAWESGAGTTDPVDVEATMNKRYVTDLAGHLVDSEDREALMACGRAILRVWAERIALRFPGRAVLFYLGGSESVILRFHVRREGFHDWLDVNDHELLRRSSMEVHELRDQGLQKLYPQ